ncbi:hypothetical protein DFH11DRAFT_1570822 [Phellopilus nigrolimitatus]|nr:hypothetical protein DFH11DRAFT_1570822 [Phellopilus nigrolimitatus]
MIITHFSAFLILSVLSGGLTAPVPSHPIEAPTRSSAMQQVSGSSTPTNAPIQQTTQVNQSNTAVGHNPQPSVSAAGDLEVQKETKANNVPGEEDGDQTGGGILGKASQPLEDDVFHNPRFSGQDMCPKVVSFLC